MAPHNSRPVRSLNAEVINDRAKLILHRFLARALRRDPGLLRDARARLAEVAEPVPDYVEAWRQILDQPVDLVARAIVRRSAQMRRLRTVSPFRSPPGCENADLRRRVWRKAKMGTAN
jgi:hypothetical protein